jgi:hypothetical protein
MGGTEHRRAREREIIGGACGRLYRNGGSTGSTGSAGNVVYLTNSN